MRNRFIFLSYHLNGSTPLYGAMKPLKIEEVKKIKKGDSCNTYEVLLNNHLGTHIDAPRHFYDSARSISEYGIEELIFEDPYVLECPKRAGELIWPVDLKKIPKKCNLLLIRTGFYKFRQDKVYGNNNPGFTPEAAGFLRLNYPRLRAIGIDSISVSAFQSRDAGSKAHRVLLGDKGYRSKPLLLIEDLNLKGNLVGLSRVYVAPLYINGIDSAPCTVFGEFENKK